MTDVLCSVQTVVLVAERARASAENVLETLDVAKVEVASDVVEAGIPADSARIELVVESMWKTERTETREYVLTQAE